MLQETGARRRVAGRGLGQKCRRLSTCGSATRGAGEHSVELARGERGRGPHAHSGEKDAGTELINMESSQKRS